MGFEGDDNYNLNLAYEEIRQLQAKNAELELVLEATGFGGRSCARLVKKNKAQQALIEQLAGDIISYDLHYYPQPSLREHWQRITVLARGALAAVKEKE
jgi:hypothetical protein